MFTREGAEVILLSFYRTPVQGLQTGALDLCWESQTPLLVHLESCAANA